MSYIGISKRAYSWMGWCPYCTVNPEKNDIPSYLRILEKGSPISGKGFFFFQLTWILVGLSFITAFAFLPSLPETIPVHWNMQGDPDGFSDKIIGAFGLPVLILALAFFLNVLPKFEKMKVNLESSSDFYQAIIFLTITLLFVVENLVLLISTGSDIPMEIVVPVLIGFFFMFLGKIMPYIKRNTTVGFRLPWTLRDDVVWKKTHEHGGKVFMLAGLLIVLESPFAGIWGIPVFLLVILFASLYIIVYSYRLSKSQKKDDGNFV